LKGATASALFGFRGANGAIMVTTKNGSTNKLGTTGLTVDVTSNTMFTAGFLAIPEVQSVYGRGDNSIYDQYSDNSWGAKMDGTPRQQWDPISKTNTVRPHLPVGKDNFSNFLEQGYVTNNNLNVAYNKDNLSLRNSLNWTENKGRYPNSVLSKFTYAFGADLNLKKFRISTNFSYARKASPNIGANNYTSYDRMYSILIWSPTDWNLADYKNNYWITPGILQQNHFGLNAAGQNAGRDENNPYFDSYEKINKISRDIFNADVTASYQLTSWLKATLRSGVDFYKEIGEVKLSKGSVLFTGGVPVPGNGGVWNGRLTGSYNIGQNTGNSMNSDLLLTGEKNISKDFRVEYLAGGTIFYKKDNNINGGTNNGISVPGFFSLAASVGPATVSQSVAAQQVNSVFGRVGVSWKNMAFIEATGREDWSSTLAKDQQSYFYPSVAGSFIASELLPQTKNWLSLLKLRSSWAMSKRPAGIYEINSTFTVIPATWGTMNGAGVPNNLYSPTIAPTSTETFEQGLQAVLFKNRLTFDVAYYSRREFDIITTVGLTQASGYSGLVTNSQEERTRRGWEIILNGSAIKKRNWQLDIGINWSTFASYYSRLDPVYSVKRPWVKVGERTDHFISRDFIRVPQGKGDQAGSIIHNGSGRPIVSGFDELFGYRDPKYIWGTNANLRYKNFNFFLSFDGVNGGLANTRTESYMWQAGVHPNSLSPERALDVATPGSRNYLGQGAKVISGTATFDPNGNILTDTRVFAPNDVSTTYRNYMFDLHNSSAWGGNGSRADTYSRTFFKLREISLTYNVPANLLHNVAKAASISLIGQNVLLKAKQFKYSDPDGGSEDLADPATRYLGFRINFTF
jgi:TonB-dependent SusC/RagA subfamily outer membrane receptor